MQNHYKYLTSIAMLFGSLLLFSNITAEKLVQFGWFTMPASILIYPLLYILGSIITEVYGKKNAATITLSATLINILMAVIFAITIQMPSASVYTQQHAYATILGNTPRLVIASLISFWAGEMLNILLTSLLKKQGRLSLQVRALICNLSGLSIDCVIFISIGFSYLSIAKMFEIAGAYYLFKVLYQIILISFMRFPIQFLTLRENHQTINKK